MTGGRVVVLGPTGRNFAAGMSGGVAYVWDPHERFLANCNLGMVELERVEADEDVDELKQLIELHQNDTGSTVAADILDRWDETLPQFVKVMPTDYKRVLMEKKAKQPQASRRSVEHANAQAQRRRDHERQNIQRERIDVRGLNAIRRSSMRVRSQRWSGLLNRL